MKVPPEVRALWSCQKRRRWNDIFELEAVGPLLVLAHWGHLMEGANWVHFIDNAAAQCAITRGSSSVHSGDVITGAIWKRIARPNIGSWFERVASKSNPLDGLSRGNSRGPWSVVVPFSFPKEVITELRLEPK